MEVSASQSLPQRFYVLEQLTDHAQAIRLIADALPVYREQMDQLLGARQKRKAHEIYQTLERQRNLLVERLRCVWPLLELEHPLASAAETLANQTAAFHLMTRDYGKLTAVLRQFSDQLPTNQTTNAAAIGRLMNNIRIRY